MEKTKHNFIGKALAILTSLIAGTWAILQYVFPEPLIYLYSIWRPEYVLVFLSILIVLLSIFIFIWSYMRNKYLFFVAVFLVYSLSSFSFFLMGREFYSASFTEGQPSETAEHGSVYYRGVEFEHNECNREADTVSCIMTVSNKRAETKIYISNWRLYMKDGSIYKDYNISQGGQKLGSSANLDLPQGVEAKVEVIFYEVPPSYNKVLKLAFATDNQEFGFKNISIISR